MSNAQMIKICESVSMKSPAESNSPSTHMSWEDLHKDFVALHVGGLSKEVKDLNLYEFFLAAGLKIVTVKVCRNVSTKESLGYGYANFFDHQEAAAAIEKLNNKMFHQMPIRLTWSIRDSKVRKNHVRKLNVKSLAESNIIPAKNLTNISWEELHKDCVALHVGGLSKKVRDVDLYKFIQAAGLKIMSVKVCRDAKTKFSLGYGYANFNDYEEAASAIEKLNNIIFYEKPIRLTWSIRDSEARKSCIGKLYLKNLAPFIGEKSLYEMFSSSGKVLSVKVARTENRSTLGYGYVQYASQELANDAIKTFNNTIVDGKKLLVTHYVERSNRADKSLYKSDLFLFESI